MRDITDPPVDEFSEEFPWADSETCDAYTSIEAKLFSWFEKEGLDLGRGAVLDLAVRMSACDRIVQDILSVELAAAAEVEV